MLALIALLHAQAALIPAVDAAQEDPVILAQARTRPQPKRTRRPARKQRARRTPQKNGFVDGYWNIFTPPGSYSIEIGLAGGTNYLQTAYGGQNPNILLRGHAAYRPDRNAPLAFFLAADTNTYEQTAGPLSYSSTYVMLGGGAGLKYWYYGMRLDLLAELGVLGRRGSQTDGRGEQVDAFTASFAGSLWANTAFSLGGHVSTSFQLGARFHSLQSFNPQDGRVDLMALLGFEYMLDAKPYDPY